MEYPLKGHNGELIKRKIIFAPPPHDAVVKVANTKEDIVVENAEVIDGGDFVLVRGHLHKSVEYLTTNKEALKKLICKDDKHDCKKEEHGHKNDHDDDHDKKPKKEVICEPICPEPKCMAVDGVIRHTTVWIPFEILVNVEDSCPGDCVVVECISIESLCKENKIQEIIEDDFIVGIAINDIINVCVRVEPNCC